LSDLITVGFHSVWQHVEVQRRFVTLRPDDMAVHPTRLKLFLAVAGLMLLMSHALRTTILAGTGGNNPALQRPRSVETSENQTGPLSEVGFYRLVQRVRQGQITTDAAIRELRQRGITFEVTDEVLDRARSLVHPARSSRLWSN
jgi:hypothetical protein